MQNLTQQTFDDFVGSQEVPILVDFWAGWCGPCLQLEPVLKDIEETETRFVIAKIDVDAEMPLANKFNLFSIPTLILFSPEGLELKRMTGFKNKEHILKELERFIQ